MGGGGEPKNFFYQSDFAELSKVVSYYSIGTSWQNLQ